MSADRPWEDFSDPMPSSAPSAPAAAAPTDPDAPWSNYTDPVASAAPQGPPVPVIAKGRLLPISKDMAGSYSFDPSAGITGDVGRAATLPGRVYSGETQMPTTFDTRAAMRDPRADPMIGEATNFGSLLGPRNPMVRSGDLAFPGVKRTAPDLTKAVTPTSEDLLASGTAGFEKYRGSNQIYPSQDVAQFAKDAKKALTASGHYADNTGEAAHGAYDVLLEKTKAQPFITAPDMDELRLALSNARGDSGAMQGRSLLYDYLKKTGDTTMSDAVADYAAGKRGQIVDTILRKSEQAKNPDVALANQLRSGAESIRTRPRGFQDSELAALDAAREGSRTVRGLEGSANLLTGNTLPTVLGRGVPIASAAGTAGFALGGPVGAAVGAAVPTTVASGMRMGAGALRRGAVEDAGNLVRQRSPLFREQVAGQDLVPTMTTKDAITNALLRMQMQRQPSPIEKYDPENYL